MLAWPADQQCSQGPPSSLKHAGSSGSGMWDPAPWPGLNPCPCFGSAVGKKPLDHQEIPENEPLLQKFGVAAQTSGFQGINLIFPPTLSAQASAFPVKNSYNPIMEKETATHLYSCLENLWSIGRF